MKQTLYDILGVARDASPEVIAAAGRQRIAELDAAPPPDANALLLVREAHQILSNPKQRSAYDASLAARAARATAAPEADDDDPPDPTFGDVLLGGWRKWALGLVVLLFRRRETLNADAVRFVNRLSDFFFVAARRA